MTFSSQVILSIFFLYVVIISEQLFSIISCRLQKLIIGNTYFKHLFIFLNIFLFTFILGWYTENSIKAVKDNELNLSNDKETFKNINEQDIDSKYNFFYLYKREFFIILKDLYYTAIIYIIFLLTTKCKLSYFGIFISFIIILFLLYIIRIYSDDKTYKDTGKFKIVDFINDKEKEQKIRRYENSLKAKNISEDEKYYRLKKFKINIKLQNIEFFLFIISLIILIYGVFVYGKEKRIEYKKTWDTKKFIFGTSKCKSIKN